MMKPVDVVELAIQTGAVTRAVARPRTRHNIAGRMAILFRR